MSSKAPNGNEARTVRTTSAAQAEALRSGALPRPEQVADGVWAIAAPVPEGGVSYTLSYVLLGADSTFHLVDPGWDSPENLTALHRSLAEIGLSLPQLATIIATHHHPDHLGIARRLQGITGAALVLSRAERAVLTHQLSPERRDPASYARTVEAWGVPAERRAELTESFARVPVYTDVEPDLLLVDGEPLQLDGHRLITVATPGHTGGHVCFVDHRRGIIYGGDHVLPQIYPGVGLGALPGEESLTDYLTSLQTLKQFADYEVLPGHEFRFRGLDVRVDDIIRHHLRRTRRVADLLAELGGAPVWEYARRLQWTSGWGRLGGFYLHSALRQTEMHLELARGGLLEGLVERYPEPQPEPDAAAPAAVSAAVAGTSD